MRAKDGPKATRKAGKKTTSSKKPNTRSYRGSPHEAAARMNDYPGSSSNWGGGFDKPNTNVRYYGW